MKISEHDWSAFLGHVNATMEAFRVARAIPGQSRLSSRGCWTSGRPSPEGRKSQNRSAW
jgi:surfactin synthase thioesterase subunit